MRAHASPVTPCATCLVLLIVTGAPGLRAAETSVPDVTLQEAGDNVILANGILTATISRSKARISSLRYRGFELLTSGYSGVRSAGTHVRYDYLNPELP